MTTKTKKLMDTWELRAWVTQYLNDINGDHVEWSRISRDPWLYDPNVTIEEAMILKLKDKCPRCGYSARYHKDDCEFSMQQLMFRELESADRGILYFNLLTEELVEKMKKLNKNV